MNEMRYILQTVTAFATANAEAGRACCGLNLLTGGFGNSVTAPANWRASRLAARFPDSARRSLIMIRVSALRFALLASIFLSGVFAVHAQAPAVKRLSPDEAVDMAIRNNLSLESERINLDTKKRKSDYVWNQFVPNVDLSGTLSRDNWANTQQGLTIPPGVFGPSPVVLSPSMTLPQWHVLGNISANLTLNFAMFAAIETVRLDYQTGLLSYEKARLQMERDIRKAYNQILLTEANAVLLLEGFANTQRQAALAEANYRAGLAPRLTWLQAQVAVENMKPTINELENGLNALRGSFAINLGLPYDTVFEFETFAQENFSIPLDVAELISKAASQKPDILELQRMIAQIQQARKAQSFQLYTPNLILAWNLNSTFLADPFKDSWGDTENWRKGGNFSVTLGMRLNTLFPFTTEGQGLKDTDNRLSSLRVNLAQAIRGTELEIFTKVNSLEKTLTSAEVQRAAVELAELSYNLTEEAYRAGLQDFQAVQSASLALDQAKLQLLTQQFNYLNDLIDLEYSAGVPFGTLSSSGTRTTGSAR